MKNNKKKTFAVLLAIAMVVVLFHFVTYESAHIIHECTGDQCPICEELHFAEVMLQNLSTAAICMVAVFFFVVGLFMDTTVLSCLVLRRNPILDRVRMND